MKSNFFNSDLKIVIYAIFFIAFYSCGKKNDPFKSISFENPVPLNGATEVAIGFLHIYFDRITNEPNLKNSFKIKKIFFDTLNPPVQILDNLSGYISYPKIKPGKTYYWSYTIENLAGEAQSDIQSFTTAGFDGNWKLESIAYGDFETSDTLLPENGDIIEIHITGEFAKIKLCEVTDTGFVDATFTLDEQMHEVTFIDNHKDKEYSYNFFNLGYLEHYQKVLLILQNNNGYFLYSRF